MSDFEEIINHNYPAPPKLTLKQKLRLSKYDNRTQQDAFDAWLERVIMTVGVIAVAASCVQLVTRTDKSLTYQERLERQYDKFDDCIQTLDPDQVRLKLVFPDYKMGHDAEVTFNKCKEANPMPAPD